MASKLIQKPVQTFAMSEREKLEVKMMVYEFSKWLQKRQEGLSKDIISLVGGASPAVLVENRLENIMREYTESVGTGATSYADKIASSGIFFKMDEKMELPDTAAGRRTWTLIMILDDGYTTNIGDQIVRDLTDINLIQGAGPSGCFSERSELTQIGRALARTLNPPHHLEHVKREWRR